MHLFSGATNLCLSVTVLLLANDGFDLKSSTVASDTVKYTERTMAVMA